MSVDPNQLLAMLGGGAGAGAAAPPPDMSADTTGGYAQAPGGGDPLEAVQSCLQDIHSLIATLPDPEDTRMAAQAMLLLLQIQKKMMAQQGQGGQ